MTLRRVAQDVLGLSANVCLEEVKQWIGKQTGRNPADVVQAQIDKALGQNEAEVRWIVSDSQKAAQSGLWTCATLNEAIAFFRLIADASPTLNLSTSTAEVMRSAMQTTALSNLELGAQLNGKPGIRRVYGKVGYWPWTGAEDMRILTSMYKLKPSDGLTHCTSVERIEYESGQVVDVGYYTAAPYHIPEHDEEGKRVADRVEHMKTRVGTILVNGLADLLAA